MSPYVSVCLVLSSLLSLVASRAEAWMLVHRSAFSGAETVVDFEIIANGEMITSQYASLGATFFRLHGDEEAASRFFDGGAMAASGDTAYLDFDPPVARAGFDVLGHGRQGGQGYMELEVNGALISIEPVFFSSERFIGVEGGPDIWRIVIRFFDYEYDPEGNPMQVATFGWIDNLRFEGDSPPPPQSVPMMPRAGLLLVAGLLAACMAAAPKMALKLRRPE